VIHCITRAQAGKVLAALQERMRQVGLELHPHKTKIVYCKDSNRRGVFEHVSFTFLGFTFRPREAVGKDGSQFTSFLPAVSKDALKKLSAQLRSWRLHRRVNATEADLARMINPVVRGWMAYYGAFYRRALHSLLHRINTYLLRWSMNKYKRLRNWKQATRAMRDAVARQPRYFAHWAWAKPARSPTSTWQRPRAPDRQHGKHRAVGRGRPGGASPPQTLAWPRRVHAHRRPPPDRCGSPARPSVRS
jgi:hypothetical protein